MTHRRKFVRRVIHPDGSVLIYGKRMVCTQGDATQFAGDVPVFGVYLDHEEEATGAMLWGHPDDEWPGRYCDSDGRFRWEWWKPTSEEGGD